MKRSFIGGECMLSGFYQELHQPQTYDCLSIQCGLEGKRFVERRCSVRFDTVCNTTAYQYYGNWNEAAKQCKEISDSYLLGNVNLTDVEQTCSIIQGKLNGPSWLGIAKETYISMGGVQDEMLKFQSPHQQRCLKCNRENCVFANCFEHHNFMCKEKEKLGKTQINNNESGSTLNATNETGSKDSSSSLIAVPVCLTLLLLLICASLIVIIIRRKKLKESENMEEPSSNKSNSVDYADYSNVGNLTENSYSELQQPNTTNQSANYSQLQFEGPDQNDYVDLRENNVAIERYSNDIYDNMAFA